MIGKYGFKESDQEDIEQSLLLSVVKGRKRKSNIADPKVSAKRIIDNEASRLFRMIRQAKREVIDHTVPLLTPVGNKESDEPVHLQDLMDEESGLAGFGAMSLEERNRLQDSIRGAYESLTDTQKRVFNQVAKTGSQTKAAENLGINPRTLRDTIKRIRKTFYEKGVLKKM